jgi:trigger factor
MAIDPSVLRIDLEEQDSWRRRLTVTVPAGSVQSERNKIVQKLGGRLKLPGFRKGKVPPHVVEQTFGPAVDQDLLDNVVGEAYRQALQIQSLEPISEGQVEDIQYKKAEDLTFSITFDVHPVFDLQRLGGFTVQRPKLEVVEADVERVMERLRDQNGVWRPQEEGGEAQDGNLVTLEMQPLKDGEPSAESRPYEIVLGDGEAVPDVEAAIRTLAVGETGDFTITFPEDFQDAERRGQQQQVRISLQARKVKELPELTDEFAKSLGEFHDLEDLRRRVREDLEREAGSQAETVVRSQLMENLMEANPFQVPRSMVDRYVSSFLGDTSKLDPEVVTRTQESLRPEAEKVVKRILLVDRVAELQGLRATEDEVDERVQAIAEQNNLKPAQVYAQMQKSGDLDALERQITEQKVYDFLKSQSKVDEA